MVRSDQSGAYHVSILGLVGFGVLKPVQRGPVTPAQTAPDAAPRAQAVL